MGKRGPASGYKPNEHPEAVRKLSARYLPKTEIAEALGISVDTYDRWLRDHPKLAESQALGREDACDHVERSLFERATGYSHPSEKIVVVSGGPGFGSHVERVDITEHYPPEPVAIKLFLTNRRPELWRDKVEHEHQGNVRIVVETGVPEPPAPPAPRQPAPKQK